MRGIQNDDWEEEYVFRVEDIDQDLRFRADIQDDEKVESVSVWQEVDGSYILNIMLANETSSMLFDVSKTDLDKWGFVL